MAGTVIGGLIGAAIGDRLDAADRKEAQQSTQHAPETSRSGTETAWRNPDSDNSGTVTPLRGTSMARRIWILLVIALSIPLMGFWGKREVKKGKPPIILDSYAASKIQPGETWRIFLSGKDNDGDMKDITVMLVEPGNVISPVSFTRIKEDKDRAEFSGYLYLHTPSESSFLGRKFLIKVQIRDRELSRSEAVKLPLTFANVPKENIPEKWQTAAKHRLGGIAIDLEELDDWRSVY